MEGRSVGCLCQPGMTAGGGHISPTLVIFNKPKSVALFPLESVSTSGEI